MRKYTFHLLTLVHLPQHIKYTSCAFSQKNRKLAKMLTSLGHTVYFYGSEGSDIEEYCNSENLIYIKTHTLKDIANDYGDGYNLDDYPSVGYNWRNTDFRHDFNSSPRKPSTLKYYKNCIEYINNIKEAGDFLLCSQGGYFKPIADAVKLYLTCEPGIGYRGSCFRFRAFESSYIQNFTYGSENPFECINGSFYDRVIPNYFSPDDVLFDDQKEDYYLFIGRMIRRKGIYTAYKTCEALKKKLIICGQGGIVLPNGNLTATDEPDFEIPPGHWEYFGYADVENRKRLMSKAIATFTPTEYMDCFCGTNVESMLHGTPPITTNFAVFPETIPDYLNGKVGFRCNTLQDFVNAAKDAKNVDHKFVRSYGERFLMDNVKWEYQKWFDDLYNVWESSVDDNKKGWHRLENV